MARKRHRRAGFSSPIQHAPTTPGLKKAQQLMAERRWTEAAERLNEFTRDHPDDTQAWTMLGEVYQVQQNISGLWQVADRLIALEPGEPEHWFNAIITCMANGLPFSALHHANHFLSQWPNHDMAGEVGKMQAELQRAADEIMAAETTTRGAAPDDLMRFEQSQMAFNHGDYERAQRIAEEARVKLPHAIAPLNNLCMAYILQGKFDAALEAAHDVLKQEPGNIHALSNLVQTLVHLGRRDEAAEVARQLRAQVPLDGTLYAKIIEALALLGDDTAVCEEYTRFEQSGLGKRMSLPTIHHLAAVSYARQGNTSRARQLWQQALRFDPYFSIARDNLDDLRRPPAERSGPWPFSITHWITKEWLQTTYEASLKAKDADDDETLRTEIKRILEEIPPLMAVVPPLLERGDPPGREFALMLAIEGELPILRDFATGQHGTDQQRMKAGQHAVEQGLLPRGKPIMMYTQGEQRELLLMAYEIYPEPEPSKLPPEADDLMNQSYQLLHKRKAKEAEPVIRQALELAPDSPILLNHLEGALRMQNRIEEANDVVRELVAKHPDYVFGRTAMARLCAQEGNVEEARTWLDPILEMPRFHISEFAALCMAQIEITLADDQIDGAHSWLNMLEQVYPDNPNLPSLRLQVRNKEQASRRTRK